MKTEYKNIFLELIGRDIQLIYSDGFIFTYGDNFLESKNVFLSIKGSGYVNVRSLWFESDETKDDVFEFEISSVTELPKKQMASIFSFFDTQRISEISIYSAIEEHKGSEVSYDYAFVIERQDSKKVCFTGGESAFRNIRLYHEESAINQLLMKSDHALEKNVMRLG